MKLLTLTASALLLIGCTSYDKTNLLTKLKRPSTIRLPARASASILHRKSTPSMSPVKPVRPTTTIQKMVAYREALLLAPMIPNKATSSGAPPTYLA